MFVSSGLLNFNGPHIDKPLMGSIKEVEDCSSNEEAAKIGNEGEVTSHGSSLLEEHFIEHLPPTLHKGNFLVWRPRFVPIHSNVKTVLF